MISTTILNVDSDFLCIDLSDFAQMISKVLIKISNPRSMLISDMKFVCHKLPTIPLKSVEDLVKHGIPVFDYFIHNNLPDPKPEWEISTNASEFLLSEYMQSIFSCYFLCMTRGKPMISENENLPKFLTDYLNITMTSSELLSYLSSNNLNKMDHFWIKNIDVSLLPRPVQQRLMSGIAGTRIINIFKSVDASQITIKDNKIIQIYNLIKNIANSGPFIEMHPFFIPVELASISLNKNLINLIIKIYTDEEINSMVRNKLLYEKPKEDLRYQQYLVWDLSTFRHFSTKLLMNRVNIDDNNNE